MFKRPNFTNKNLQNFKYMYIKAMNYTLAQMKSENTKIPFDKITF